MRILLSWRVPGEGPGGVEEVDTLVKAVDEVDTLVKAVDEVDSLIRSVEEVHLRAVGGEVDIPVRAAERLGAKPIISGRRRMKLFF